MVEVVLDHRCEDWMPAWSRTWFEYNVEWSADRILPAPTKRAKVLSKREICNWLLLRIPVFKPVTFMLMHTDPKHD